MNRWLVLGIVVNALVLVLAVGGSYALSLAAFNQRQQVWCPLLADLTSRPLPPSASRQDVRTFGELLAVRNAWC